MPLFQYFGWVGGFLFAALLAANWCVSAPIAAAPRSDVPFDRKINIRIHSDQKWPERVVFDTTRPTLTQKPDARTDIGGRETPVLAERQPFDAFAEMAAIPARTCFRPSCLAGQTAEREASPIDKGAPPQNRLRTTARKGLTSPNPLHKPPGKN
jgi:hypothetical protein